MARACSNRGLTLVEVLVVAGVGVLLSAVVLPGLAAGNRESRTARCLSNLREIGRASLFYATDDDYENIVPLGMVHVRDWPTNEHFPGEWGWRTAEPFSFGGRAAIAPFPVASEQVRALMSPEEGGKYAWQPERRPLNRYIAGGPDPDPQAMEVYHCPFDTGYPDADWVGGAPPSAAGIPCYDFLGNSYRMNTTGLAWMGGGSFTSGPWGHMASSIASTPAETVLYCEPIFYGLTRTWPDYPDAYGWHGDFRSDNVVYCDGSARLTRSDPIYEFSNGELEEMGYTQHFEWNWFLRRGPGYQMDCYPTPGAQIGKYNRSNVSVTPQVSYGDWPFDNCRHNLRPDW